MICNHLFALVLCRSARLLYLHRVTEAGKRENTMRLKVSFTQCQCCCCCCCCDKRDASFCDLQTTLAVRAVAFHSRSCRYNCSQAISGYLSQPRQVFDTGLWHTHGGARLCQTLQLQYRPAQPPALLLSCLVRNNSVQQTRAGWIKSLAPCRNKADIVLDTQFLIHSSLRPLVFCHLIFPQRKCQDGAASSICMQRHITVSVWVLIVVGDVLHTQKDISQAADKAKRERGWVTILHPGWSAPTCGKTQYLHFAIRTTFLSLYFPQHRLHAPL